MPGLDHSVRCCQCGWIWEVTVRLAMTCSSEAAGTSFVDTQFSQAAVGCLHLAFRTSYIGGVDLDHLLKCRVHSCVIEKGRGQRLNIAAAASASNAYEDRGKPGPWT